MASRILLKGGTILAHDESGHVVPKKADLLIENSTIVDIAGSISVSEARVIDCVGKIVSPGFIDTHHHVWQTQLRGTHADETLLEYFYTGNFISSFYTPKDVFWGQLAGCMEMIDGGTTTVVDHASITCSPEHAEQAIRATIASGIRSIYCYQPILRVKTWKPVFTVDQDLFPSWVMETWDTLAKLNPFGPNGRVRLGFAFDGLWLPGDVLKGLFERVRRQGSQLITTHSVYCSLFGGGRTSDGSRTALKTLSSHSLLSSDILLSHNNNPTSEDLKLLQSSGAHISATPSTELQMSHGNPVGLEPGFFQQSSLGVDCHTLCSAFMPSQMMLALQWARGRRNEEFEIQGKWPASVGPKVEDVFNLGTILGAKAVGLENEIGSLNKGKKADIVIFEGSTPNMVAATARDPVAAIVLHSSIRDVSCVIVDGVVRKEAGALVDVKVPPNIQTHQDEGGETLAWERIASEIAKGAELIDRRKREDCDVSIAKEGVMQAFRLNPAGMADTI